MKSTALFLLILILNLGLSAQSIPSSQTKSDNDQELIAAQESLNLRIIEVLHQTANEAKGWDNVKVSSQIQAQIADLIWDFDAISAKSYLIRAWDKAKQATESDEKTNQYRNSSNRIDVSQSVLLVARKREPELAEKWLKELSDLAEEDFEKRNKGLFDDRTARSAVLLQIAMQVVETDVEAAASLAIESLRDGISFGFQAVLIKIQIKNPELAVQVFRAALQRINTTGITNANEIQILYSYLYTPGIVSTTANSTSQGASTISVTRNQNPATPLAQLYPALAQEFLQSAAQAILRMPFLISETNPETAAREQYGIINTILFRLGNSSPELSNALRERLAAIRANANFAPDSPASNFTPINQGEKLEDYKERLLDELLEKAEKINNSLERDIFIAQGVLRSDAEQFEKAKSIAEKIEEKELRQQIIYFLIYRKSLDLIAKDQISDAYKLLQKNGEPRQRAAILIVGGQKLIEQKDTQQAREWLREADKLFEKNNGSDEDWINIGFGMASIYSELDNIEAVNILNKCAKLIKKDSKNYNMDKAPLAVSFSGLNYSDFTHGTKNFSLNSAIKAFPKENFEDVLTALGEISNPQAKGQGIIVLSLKYLKKQKTIK